MGDLRFAVGSLLNLGHRARSASASSGLTGYGLANALDPDVDDPWIAAAGATDVQIDVDLALDDKGDFETWAGGVPAGWTFANTGTATIAEEATHIGSGAKSLKLVPGASGVCRGYRDYTVAAGEEVSIVAKGAGGVALRIYDPVMRKWWVSGAWTASEGDALVFSNGTPLVSGSVTVTMPAFAASFLDQVPLRVFVYYATNSTAYVDSLFVCPTWDVVSVHGHAIDAGCTVTLTASDDGSSYSTPTFARAAAVARPSFYARTSSLQAKRYVRLLFGGTNYEQLHACRVVVAQTRAAPRSWTERLGIDWQPSQVRHTTPAGVQRIVGLAADLPRRLNLELIATDLDEFAESAREIWHRTAAGEHAVLLIPDVDLGEIVYGRVAEDPLSTAREVLSEFTRYRITVVEDPHSTVGA